MCVCVCVRGEPAKSAGHTNLVGYGLQFERARVAAKLGVMNESLSKSLDKCVRGWVRG